jgi:hypothetical protein
MSIESLLPFNLRAGTFIRAPLFDVVDCLVEWGNSDRVRRSTVAQTTDTSLQHALKFLSPRDFNPSRAVLTNLGGQWTVFLDNHSQQHLPLAELFNTCRFLNTDGYFFFFDHCEETEHFGSAQFCAYTAGGSVQRQVMLSKEGGWKFHQSGTPLPFENLEAYTRSKKKDRLNLENLREYGAALDMPFWDESAYGSELVLLNWNRHAGENTREALQEVMRVFGHPDLVVDGRLRNQ